MGVLTGYLKSAPLGKNAATTTCCTTPVSTTRLVCFVVQSPPSISTREKEITERAFLHICQQGFYTDPHSRLGHSLTERFHSIFCWKHSSLNISFETRSKRLYKKSKTRDDAETVFFFGNCENEWVAQVARCLRVPACTTPNNAVRNAALAV